ncbi:unnamed protein product [Meganyctiphanes norvegica]|uniref:K Homology domain-containing protein n=1 Tax=Meganyctiphanes norvegica TaxID=48144 RepID=A0AAV2Q937_MEGNR
MERVQSGRKSEEKRAVEVTKEKSIKVTVKVLVPVREHPKFNFVGKLLGPKGNSLKRLQEETMTKMAILGKGSFRDKAKEQELCKNPDPKYGHLQEELHVEVTAHAPPAEAYARIAYALTEIRRYLVPDHNDEIRQEQMREMQILNGRPGMPDVNGQDQADSNGSLSPPSSLSPGPTLPVKLSTAQQLAAQAAQAAASANANNQAQSLLTHPAMRGLTRAQMGLLTTSMPATGMTTSVPTLAPSMPGAMLGRFPFMPMGSAAMTPMGAAAQAVPVAAAAAAAAQRRSALDFLNPKTRDDLIMQSGPHPPSTTPFLAPPDQYTGYSLTVGMPMGYEEYPTTDMTSALTATHDFDGSLDIDKKDPLKRNMNRGQFRHEPYRRLAVNVPS